MYGLMPMPRGRPSRVAAPAWALSIKMRRLAKGIGQEAAVERGGDVFTQGWLSDLERGKIDLRQAGFVKVVALARALDWTLGELQEATGIDLGVETARLEFVSDRIALVYPLATASQNDAEALPGAELLRGVHPERFRIFRVDVPDMDASTLTAVRPGEHVYVDLDDTTPQEGHVYVITHDGRPRVRRYAETPFGFAWVADNRDFDPIPPTRADVIGRVYRVTSDRVDPKSN